MMVTHILKIQFLPQGKMPFKVILWIQLQLNSIRKMFCVN